MPTLLTTRDVQELINVDKSTIYRMAEDGRLPAVKVGRQWRFPASAIASLLGEGIPALAQQNSSTGSRRLADFLQDETAQAVADLLGDLFGAMAVVVDIDGSPLTTVANPCGYYRVVEAVPGSLDLCIDGWRSLASAPDLESKLMASHLGFLCARSYIRLNNHLIGMVIVGGITPISGSVDRDTLGDIAAEVGISPRELAAHAHETYDLSPGERERVLRLLPRFTDVLSRLISSRHADLARIEALTSIAGGAANQ